MYSLVAGAVDTLVSGRGVRTVPRAFSSANKTPPAPALADDVVTVTPVVVVPAGRTPTGPLAPLALLEGRPSNVDADDDVGSPAAKRPRTIRAGASSASAFALRPSEAESVCYGVQLRSMPGKFDAAAATRLGVPTGKIRSRLVRGEDVTLDDGRVIRSADVVSPARLGLRFIILDVPTRAHFDAIRDPTSAAATALASLADARDAGELAVVIHLAPAALATDPEYVEWASAAPSLRNATRAKEDTLASSNPSPVRHVMAHSEATRRAPVFRSAATTSAKLHAVDARTFPDPRFATRADADAADADVAAALQREAEHASERDGESVPDRVPTGDSVPKRPKTPALFHPGQNMLRYTLVPLARAGLDRSEIRRFVSPRDVRDQLDAASLADPSPRRNRDASRRSIVDRLMRRRPRSIPARTFPFPTRFAPCARATRRLRFSARDRRRPPSTETSPVFFSTRPRGGPRFWIAARVLTARWFACTARRAPRNV